MHFFIYPLNISFIETGFTIFKGNKGNTAQSETERLFWHCENISKIDSGFLLFQVSIAVLQVQHEPLRSVCLNEILKTFVETVRSKFLHVKPLFF